MLRVLHLITTLDIGGAEAQVFEVVSRFDRNRFRPEIAYLKAESDQFSYTVQNSVGATSAPGTVFLTIDPALRLENTAITLPATPPPTVFQIVDALPGVTFDEPICLATIPGDPQRLFVVQCDPVVAW